MAEFESLGRDVYCIDALYVKPRVASIYLIVDCDEAAIIETGTRHSLDNVLATLEALGVDDSQVRYIIPTHVHLDHAGGAGIMMQRFGQARLIIHPRGARHMEDPTRLVEGTIPVYGREQFELRYGRIEPVPADRISVAEDLDRYSLGKRELVFFDTPGHARHHFCIYDETSEGVFTGDTFGLSYDPMKHLPRGLVPTSSPPQFDPPALQASVARILSYRPKRAYLTHYGALENPLAHEQSLPRWIDEYVEICERLRPQDENGERELEQALERCIVDTIAPAGERDVIARCLKADMLLNAQGLAIWWRRSRHG